MTKFEGLFEDLDVHTQVMDSSMATATTLSTPEGQVDSLMKQVYRPHPSLYVTIQCGYTITMVLSSLCLGCYISY